MAGFNTGVATFFAAKVPVVGTFLADAIDWVGKIVKGSTVHPTYQQVKPKAEAFASAMLTQYASFYPDAMLEKIGDYARKKMLSYMSSFWGLSNSTNYAMAQDLGDPNGRQHVSGKWILWLVFHHFYLWIGTNIDADTPSSFEHYFDALWPDVFLQSITDAGGDPSKTLSTTGAGAGTGGGSGIGAGTGGGTTTQGAGFGGSTLMYLAIAGAVLYFLLKGK